MLDDQVTALRKHNASQAKDIPIFEKILFSAGAINYRMTAAIDQGFFA
jgi:hypothetical protein